MLRIASTTASDRRSLGAVGRCNTSVIRSAADGIEAVGVDRRQGYRWVKTAGGRNAFAHTLRSDRYLSQEERLQIADLRLGGESVRAIATALGRAPSTNSREQTKNSAAGGTYRPYSAEK